jgi:hypothetical protein
MKCRVDINFIPVGCLWRGAPSLGNRKKLDLPSGVSIAGEESASKAETVSIYTQPNFHPREALQSSAELGAPKIFPINVL